MACIGIDCRFAALPVGLGTYTRQLVSALLPKLADHHVCIFVRSKDEAWLRDIPDVVQVVECAVPHYSLAEQIVLPRRIKQLSIDLWYALHFNVPLFPGVPFVATVHDLILHAYPNQASLPKRLAYRFLMRNAVKNAAELIAVSKYTANDIARTYGRQPLIVSEGAHPRFQKLADSDVQQVLGKYDVSEGYFLYVGGNKQHKNVQLLIDAHAASGVVQPLALVTSADAADSLRLSENVTILTNVPEADLPALYSGATAFVTASLYEGFCLPILEARACGCPIIAVNRTAIPEIAGSDARLIEPTTEALLDALRRPPTTTNKPDAVHSWDTAASAVCAILTDTLNG